MISYEDFTLSKRQIDYLKKRHQRKAISNYISVHGTEPDAQQIKSWYTCTEKEMEVGRLAYYSLYLSEHGGEDDEDSGSDTDEEIETPFTIEALGYGDIQWGLREKQLQYSKNDGSWSAMNSATTIHVENGDIIRFKGNNITYAGNTIISTARFNVSGNIMSLTNGDDYKTTDTLPRDSAEYDTFNSLFFDCITLVSAKNLVLPALNLSYACYRHMFKGCISLTEAPEILPATNLAEECYAWMFLGCTSLVDAPVICATTLASACCRAMFWHCTGLTHAPELPATTLAENCYEIMFEGCISLTSTPRLPATKLAMHCYANMFLGCENITTVSELPATTLAENCYNSMFKGCKALTVAPELPATQLKTSCYESMFMNCTGLVVAPELNAIELDCGCYKEMFCGCTSLAKAPELPTTYLAWGDCYKRMFTNCSNLNYIKALFNPDDYDESGLIGFADSWVSGVASVGTFVKNPDAEFSFIGIHGIPEGWKTIDADKLIGSTKGACSFDLLSRNLNTRQRATLQAINAATEVGDFWVSLLCGQDIDCIGENGNETGNVQFYKKTATGWVALACEKYYDYVQTDESEFVLARDDDESMVAVVEALPSVDVVTESSVKHLNVTGTTESPINEFYVLAQLNLIQEGDTFIVDGITENNTATQDVTGEQLRAGCCEDQNNPRCCGIENGDVFVWNGDSWVKGGYVLYMINPSLQAIHRDGDGNLIDRELTCSITKKVIGVAEDLIEIDNNHLIGFLESEGLSLTWSYDDLSESTFDGSLDAYQLSQVKKQLNIRLRENANPLTSGVLYADVQLLVYTDASPSIQAYIDNEQDTIPLTYEGAVNGVDFTYLVPNGSRFAVVSEEPTSGMYYECVSVGTNLSLFSGTDKTPIMGLSATTSDTQEGVAVPESPLAVAIYKEGNVPKVFVNCVNSEFDGVQVTQKAVTVYVLNGWTDYPETLRVRLNALCNEDGQIYSSVFSIAGVRTE